ncbi:MAG: hypothetical protein Q7S40_33180 [Opitutaceae bacterium]|nr:hypothetical protein [Opitutaceae bacterium]
MLFDLAPLLLGLLLLWFPRQLMRLGAVVRRHRASSAPAKWKSEPWNTQEPGDPRLSFLLEFTKGRNYSDLLRAAAGSLVIVGGLGIQPAISAASGSNRMLMQQVLGVKLLILLVAVLIQTMRIENRRLSFFAPVFFLAGLSVSLCGHWAALFAFILVWAVNPMFKSAHGFLAGYGVLMALFGYLFRDVDVRLILGAAVLCLVPVMLSLLTRRRLGVFTRKPTHVRTG